MPNFIRSSVPSPHPPRTNHFLASSAAAESSQEDESSHGLISRARKKVAHDMPKITDCGQPGAMHCQSIQTSKEISRNGSFQWQQIPLNHHCSGRSKRILSRKSFFMFALQVGQRSHLGLVELSGGRSAGLGRGGKGGSRGGKEGGNGKLHLSSAVFIIWQRGGYNRYAVKQASRRQGRVASSNMFFDELEYGN